MKLNELSRQTGVYTQTLRYKASRLFGRTSGEFTDDECAMILESFNEGTAAVAEWNKRQDLSSGKRQDLSSGKRQDLSSGKRQDLSSGKRQDLSSGKRQDLSSGKRQDLSSDKSRHKKYRHMKDEDILALDTLLFWRCPNYKIIPNRVLVLKDLLQRLTNIGAKEAERMRKLEKQAEARFNAELDKYMSDDMNTKSLEYQWKLLQHPQKAVKYESESDDF